MGLLGYDDFTDTDAVTLQSHTPSNGSGWTRHGSAATNFEIQGNRIRGTGTTSFYYKGDAPSANGQMVVSGRIRLVGGTVTRIALVGRMKTGAPSWYMGGHDGGGLFLTRVVSGSPTTLSVTAYTLVSGEDYLLDLVVTDATKSITITRVSTGVSTTLTSADNTLTAASGDRAGVYADAATTTTTGTHMDAFEASDPATVTATQVANNRVFQRAYGGGARSVTFAGTYTGTPTKIQVRVMRSSAEVVGWTDATLNAGSYSAALLIPEGGGLTQQVRVTSGRDAVLASASPANQFGVGVLVTGIGNSNLVGLASGTNTTANASVFRIADAGTWAAISGLSGKISNDSTNATAIPDLMADLQAALVADGNANAVVGYVYASRGLSPLRTVAGTIGSNTYANGDCWSYRTTRNDAATVYGRAMTFLDAADSIAPEFCVINVGDDDAGFAPTVQQWKDAFASLKTNWDADLINGASTKFILNVIGRYTGGLSGGDAYFDNVRQAQSDLVDGTRVFSGTSLIDLGLTDNVHLNAAGYVTMGKRVARSIVAVLASSANVGDPIITGAAFTDSGRTVIRVTISHRGGTDIAPTTAIPGFTVTDTGGAKTISSAVRQTATAIDITLSSACAGSTTIQYLSGQNPSGPTGLLADNRTPTGPVRPAGNGFSVTAIQSARPRRRLGVGLGMLRR